MAIIEHVLASGLSPRAALAVNGGNYQEGALTATGSSRTDSFLLPGGKNYFSTVASGSGAQLPQIVQGGDVFVYNGGANALLVYTNAQTSETITTGAATAGFSVPAGKGAIFSKATNTLWMVNLSA